VFFYSVSCRLNDYSYYQDADQRADASKDEKEEILAKLSQSEKAQTEWKSRVSKLEDDNARLRRAVEQSMTRLNRMSVDSDYLVDRLTCLCS
jgi:dsDNA-specific endonuclease/ATPase MutS2